MAFPVLLRLGPVALHPHWVFESLAYLAGILIYARLKARMGDPIPPADRSTILAAAAVGAAIGGKLIYWLSDPALTLDHWRDPFFLMAGKSIVGGLVGGYVAVELVKRRLSVTRSTGDLLAIPIAAGIAIGRIGCFLTGLDDHTHGLPTALPWGVDFGDGLARHPAQLYEVAFLLALLPVLWIWQSQPHREGDIFKGFLIAYLGFRLGLEFLKPGSPFLGLNAIQWCCLGVLLGYARTIPVWWRRREVAPG